MKLVNKALLGALTLATAATVSHAQTRVYINGSTAFRGAAVPAIHALFDSGVYFGYQGSSESGANANIYSGTIGGQPYIIKSSWTGSESGLQAIVADSGSGVAINFVQDVPTIGGSATALTTGGVSGLDDPTATTGTTNFEQHVPDLSFSDTYQATSQFAAGASVKYTGGDNQKHTMGAATPATTSFGNGVIGIIPFVFAASSHADFTNIDDQTIANIYTKLNGVAPRALFSGVASDSTRVYAMGRNPDSGTRLNAFANSGVGALTSVTQYEPFNSSGAQISGALSTIATVAPWVIDTVNHIKEAAGNSGYNSGGKLAGAVGSETSGMVSPDSVTGGDIVAYLGYSDYLGATAGGCFALTFDGVPFSYTAIEQGQYKFWGYEHLYIGTTPPDGAAATTIANSLATAIYNTTSGNRPTKNGLVIVDVISNMSVHRSGIDGSSMVANYTY